MFKLPIPTDSLYKFSFMFGLVMIVFSIYFNETHLNKLNKNQPSYLVDSLLKLDSLQFTRKLQVDSLLRDAEKPHVGIMMGFIPDNEFLHICDGLMQAKMIDTLKPLDYIDVTFKNAMLNANNNSVGQPGATWYSLIGDRYKDLLQQHSNSIKYYNKVEESDKKSFWSLLGLGGILFVLGIIGWYFKIQLLQDRLLFMQTKQVRKQNILFVYEHKIKRIEYKLKLRELEKLEAEFKNSNPTP